MTIAQLQALVDKGENQIVEFKRKVKFPEKIAKEVVAFANSQGGYLIVGVDDNRSIPGLKFADEEKYVLDQTLEKLCKPRIPFNSEIIKLNEHKSVIVYQIYSSKNKPHYLIENNISGFGTVYVRVDDRSIQASRELKEILKRGRKNKDIKFYYGEKERLLMKYLDENETITVEQFAKVGNLKKITASNTLVILVLANVLIIDPGEREDTFRLKKIEIGV